MLSQLLEDVLRLAPEYSPEWNSVSASRRSAVSNVRDWLQDHPALLPGAAGTVWSVADGGTNGNAAYVPWVRVFDSSRWRHAAQGLNIGWFFSGSGETVNLSLLVATSTYGATGRTRHRSDRGAIQAEAEQLRSHLELPGRLRSDGVDEIDLGLAHKLGDGLNAGAVRRVQNYEAAHVCGFRYQRHQIPDDETLLSDQHTLLRILLDASQEDGAALRPNGAPRTEASPTIETAGTCRRMRYSAPWRTRVPDAKRNKAVELQAMSVVEDHYSSEGWTCIDVSGTEPFDLKLVRGDEQLHVEVKGLSGPGEAVTLTANEVRHAQTFPNCILAVVDDIRIEETPNGPAAAGGALRLWDPWIIDEDRLRPTQYRYGLT